MNNIKNEILSKLDFLPDKTNFENDNDEIVVLNADYHSQNYHYQLAITLEVNKATGEKGVYITGFKIQGIDLFRGNGFDPPFKFTKKDIYNYIDYH